MTFTYPCLKTSQRHTTTITLSLIVSFLFLSPLKSYCQNNLIIKEFKIVGVKQVSKSELLEVLTTASPSWSNLILLKKKYHLFDNSTFEKDLQRILKFYRLKGFFHTRIADYQIKVDDEKREVRLLVKVAESEPTRITKITFTPADSNNISDLWPTLYKYLDIKEGGILNQEKIQNTRIGIISRFADIGRPFAKVIPEIKQDDVNRTADLNFIVDPGKGYNFGAIKISGNKKYPKHVIRNEIAFKEGRRFEQSKLLVTQQGIYRLELFESVRIRADLERDISNGIPIEIKVKEAPRRVLKTGIGYGTEDKFRSIINIKRRNIFGGARRLEGEVKFSKLEPGRLQISIFQPQVPDSKTSIQFSPFYRRQKENTFRIDRFGAEILTQRNLSKYSDGFLRYRYEIVRDDTSSARKKSILSLGLFTNSSRPIFSPKKGTFRSFVLDWSGLFLDSNSEYLKGVAEYRNYFRATKNNIIIASRIKAGRFFLLSNFDQTVPPEELFFAGGSASVRGWKRNELKGGGNKVGGQSLLEGSVEMRIKILGALGCVIFTDFGNVWDTSFPDRTLQLLNDLFYASGWGLRYDTPIGPARLDFAWKLNKQTTNESRFEFHLSVGHAF